MLKASGSLPDVKAVAPATAYFYLKSLSRINLPEFTDVILNSARSTYPGDHLLQLVLFRRRYFPPVQKNSSQRHRQSLDSVLRRAVQNATIRLRCW